MPTTSEGGGDRQARLRAAAPEDAGAISALVTSLARELVVGEYTAAGREAMLASMTPAAIARLFTPVEGAPRFVLLVAEDPAGRLIGVAVTRDDAHLYHLFVARDWHGRGVGRRLWERARAGCVARAGTRRFTVCSSSFAREVYLRFGFRPTGPAEERGGVISHPMALELEAGGG
jgi:GNAT superfamily N-acetyltransferase